MKFLTLSFFLLPISLLAQFSKGDKFIGGNLVVDIQRVPDTPDGANTTELTQYSLGPRAGYFLSESVALLGEASYTHSHQEYKFSQQTTSNYKRQAYTVGAGIQKYFALSEKFLFVVKSSTYYSRSVHENIYGYDQSKEKEYIVGVGVVPEFIFFPTRKWAIFTDVGAFNFSHTGNLSTDVHSNELYIRYGQILFGFSYYLRN